MRATAASASSSVRVRSGARKSTEKARLFFPSGSGPPTWTSKSTTSPTRSPPASTSAAPDVRGGDRGVDDEGEVAPDRGEPGDLAYLEQVARACSARTSASSSRDGDPAREVVAARATAGGARRGPRSRVLDEDAAGPAGMQRGDVGSTRPSTRSRDRRAAPRRRPSRRRSRTRGRGSAHPAVRGAVDDRERSAARVGPSSATANRGRPRRARPHRTWRATVAARPRRRPGTSARPQPSLVGRQGVRHPDRVAVVEPLEVRRPEANGSDRTSRRPPARRARAGPAGGTRTRPARRPAGAPAAASSRPGRSRGPGRPPRSGRPRARGRPGSRGPRRATRVLVDGLVRHPEAVEHLVGVRRATRDTRSRADGPRCAHVDPATRRRLPRVERAARAPCRRTTRP